MLGVCLFGLSQVYAVFAASARDEVPPSSQKQWNPPNLAGYQDTLQKGSAEALEKGKELVDLRKEYTLPDLIDIAEQLNPATRQRGRMRGRHSRWSVSVSLPITLFSR